MRGAAGSKPPKVVITTRWIPDKGEAGRYYASVAYWVLPDLSLGFDYRPLVDSVELTSTWRVFSEDPDHWYRPALIVGTSKEDFHVDGVEVESRAFFGTLSKALPKIDALHLAVAPYVGGVWLDEPEKFRPLAGVNLHHRWASLMYQYSGTDSHLTLTRSINANLSVSAIYWGLKHPGVGLRYSF